MSLPLLELWRAIDSHAEAKTAGMRCCLPGSVDAYDAKTCTATVKITIQSQTGLDYPLITNVPVVWPRTAKFVMAAPLDRGDGVLLLFSDQSIAEWQAAKDGQVAIPQDTRTHDLTDAIAIPGLFGSKSSFQFDGADELQIWYNNNGVIRMQADGTIDLNDGSLVVKP